MLLPTNCAVRFAVAAVIPFIALAQSAVTVQAQEPLKAAAHASNEDDSGPPILRRGSKPKIGNGDAGSTNDAASAEKVPAASPRPVEPNIAPGLPLPSTGRAWALDTFEGKLELVHLTYLPVSFDKHTASNFAKVNLAPFIAKPKVTIEIAGARAAVRLHESNPAIFVRWSPVDDEDAAPHASIADTHTELALLKLKVRGDKRVVGTMAYTQLTGKASRTETLIQITREQVPNSNWLKIRPRQPLAPGEYGLVCLPTKQDFTPTRVFDFAIDPTAPGNSSIAPQHN